MESVTMVVPGCSRSRIADIMAMSRLQLSSLFRDGNGVGVQSSYVNVGFLVEGNDEHVFIAIGVGQGDGVFPEAVKMHEKLVSARRIGPDFPGAQALVRDPDGPALVQTQPRKAPGKVSSVIRNQ